ncbi:hypothetical protein [Streptomyces sp. NPDC051162]|uniref:hypothetical protein n=1 Tax=unclassified Streptomyces TaxID=2593676 RepID=UPI00341DB90B
MSGNEIQFDHHFDDDGEVVPRIDGIPLTELIDKFETGARMQPAGNAYGGLIPQDYRFGSVEDHFHGWSTDAMGSKTPVLGCSCGEWGCWPLMTRITTTADAVTWDSFEQPYRTARDYTAAEREELLVAERVLNRLAEQDRVVTEAAEAAAPVKVQVAGRAVLLIPHRGEVGDEGALPADYRRILAIVRAAGGAVQVKAVGEELGLEVGVRGKLEPLRAKMTKLADRGWLHKRPDGKFTARL